MSVRLSTTAIAVLTIVSVACGPESNAEMYDTAAVSQASCNPEYQDCGETCEDLGTCPEPSPESAPVYLKVCNEGYASHDVRLSVAVLSGDNRYISGWSQSITGLGAKSCANFTSVVDIVYGQRLVVDAIVPTSNPDASSGRSFSVTTQGVVTNCTVSVTDAVPPNAVRDVWCIQG